MSKLLLNAFVSGKETNRCPPLPIDFAHLDITLSLKLNMQIADLLRKDFLLPKEERLGPKCQVPGPLAFKHDSQLKSTKRVVMKHFLNRLECAKNLSR